MFNDIFRPLLWLGWAAAMPVAWAKTAVPSAVSQAPASRAAPLQTSVPLNYQSVFTDYQPFREQAVDSWVEANRTVEQIGGWRAYAKEASQPEDRPAPAPDGKGVKP